MEVASFSERLMLNDDRLTDFERTFSRFVMSNPSLAASETVSSLAKQFYVSPNSIVRFAHKLGYKGFSDMRISIGRELEENDRNQKDVATNNSLSTERLVRRTFDLCCRPHMEQRGAQMMRKAESVAFFAVGETAYVVHAYARILGEFDGKTQFVTYKNQVNHEIERYRSKLVVVLVSLSGETPQVLEVADHALEHQANIISLTDLKRCSLSRKATLSLYCCSPQHFIYDVNVTDLTPLCAALASLEETYLKELGIIEQPQDQE